MTVHKGPWRVLIQHLVAGSLLGSRSNVVLISGWLVTYLIRQMDRLTVCGLFGLQIIMVV
jgi:hypothetical protein